MRMNTLAALLGGLFILLGLPGNVHRGTISPATTLSKWWHSWRIKHPQAESHDENLPSFPETSATAPEVYLVSGHGSGAKEKAPAAPFFVGRCFAATRSAIVSNTMEITLMIYTFLISRADVGRLADLRRIRTISAVADTEQQARSRLAGLPLVFVSRTPSKGVAA